MRTIAIIGSWANIVVCIYAVILALLNIIGAATDIRFVLFFVFVPLPFYLRGVFAKMRLIHGADQTSLVEWPQWVWASAVFGVVVSLGLLAWLLILIPDLFTNSESSDASVYLVAGVPLFMLVGASALLWLLIDSRRR